MPSKYGVISKAFTQKPNAGEAATTLDIYVLSQNSTSQLTLASTTLKNNLKSYINEYRMIGDTISIKNAFIINFAIDFEIITYPNYNNNEVLQRCIIALQNYFNLDIWQINQPILTPDLYVLLDAIDGVQTVKQINFTNKAGTSQGYSEWAYDMNGANQNGTIFPSLDPSIFELKFPNTDIKGRVVTLF
jgi:phage-related baseplate assembly protein